MNKARPLLLERPGFFSAVRRGGGEDRRWAGERVAARQGRGALCIAGRDAPQGCGRPAGQRGACRVAPGRAGGTARAHGDTPERTGHPRARRDTTGRMGAHPSAHRGTAGRAGHPRAHGDIPGRMGATAECTGTPQGARGHRRARRGHPRAQGGASKQSVCGRKKGPPAAARRGQKNLFCFAKKIFNFLAKTVDKPLGRW